MALHRTRLENRQGAHHSDAIVVSRADGRILLPGLSVETTSGRIPAILSPVHLQVISPALSRSHRLLTNPF